MFNNSHDNLKREHFWLLKIKFYAYCQLDLKNEVKCFCYYEDFVRTGLYKVVNEKNVQVKSSLQWSVKIFSAGTHTIIAKCPKTCSNIQTLKKTGHSPKYFITYELWTFFISFRFHTNTHSKYLISIELHKPLQVYICCCIIVYLQYITYNRGKIR